MIHRPNAAALIVCHQVIVEEHTRDVTFINSFHRLAVDGFPSSPRRFMVCAYLRDGLGDVNLRVVVTQLEAFEEIYSRTVRFNFTDRLRIYRLLWPVSQLAFPAPGQYEIRLFAGADSIADSVIQVLPRG